MCAGTGPGPWRPGWDWAAACAALAALAPALTPALAVPLPPRPERSPWAQLCRCILAQQVSVAAADAMERRLLAACGGEISPSALGRLGDGDLRGAGLSRQKIRYLRGLLATDLDGVLAPAALAAEDDAAVVTRLTSLPGFGRWSAELFLIFGLHRPDVLPAGDLGIQAAAGALLLGGRRPSPAELRVLGGGWAPHRSTAALALWAWRRAAAARPVAES